MYSSNYIFNPPAYDEVFKSYLKTPKLIGSSPRLLFVSDMIQGVQNCYLMVDGVPTLPVEEAPPPGSVCSVSVQS